MGVVNGCINANGVITFAGLEECVSQSVCVELAGGEHEGMVALTMSGACYNAECNDTFYGCLDATTGQFKVTIPTSCCYCC